MYQSMVSGKNQGNYFKSAFLIQGHTNVDVSACTHQPAFKENYETPLIGKVLDLLNAQSLCY